MPALRRFEIDTVRLCGTVAALLLIATTAAAQPVGGQILDKVSIKRHDGCFLVSVAFTLPVRYVSHFPVEGGDELRVQINPVISGAADRAALTGREAAGPRPVEGLPLTDVTYEGDLPGGPFLLLLFDRKVTYNVRQGPDFRSIIVQVRPPGHAPGEDCPPLDQPAR